MGDQTNELGGRDVGKSLHRRVQRPHPARQLARRVYVLRLLFQQKVLLVPFVELHHRARETRLHAHQQRLRRQQSAIEGGIDLDQRLHLGVVHEEHWRVRQEARRQRHTSGVRRRVAGTHELDVLRLDPQVVARVPESALFDDLTEEADDALRSVLVLLGKVHLVAEHDERLVRRCRT